jgi:hypothetical protein
MSTIVAVFKLSMPQWDVLDTSSSRSMSSPGQVAKGSQRAGGSS